MDRSTDAQATPLPASERPAGSATLRDLARRAAEHREILGIAILLAAVGLAMLRVVLASAPLGWDESAYASQTRFFVTGVPTLWPIHRPPGLPIAGLVAVPFGLTDTSLHVIAAAFGLLALGLAWGSARLLWGGLAAAIALVAVVASPVILDELVLFHNDVPSAGAVLGLMILLWWQLEVRERPTALLVAAGPIAAAAFYLRYGALALLVGVALAAILLWGRRLIREPRLVGSTLLVALALFLPHVVDAVARTGSPLGIVRAAVAQVDTSTPSQAALQYVRWIPAQLAGVGGGILVIAAVVAVLHAAAESIRDRRPTHAARRLVWLLGPAIVAAVGTVMVSHAEARYVLTSVVLTEIAGAGAVATVVTALTRRVARRRPAVARLAVPAIAVGLVVVLAIVGRSWIRSRTQDTGDQWMVDAGHAIATDAGGSCTLASALQPILGWYSGCTPIGFDDPGTARALAGTGRPTYVVFSSLDRSQGTTPELLAAYRADLDLVEIARSGKGQRAAIVYRVRP